MINCLRSLVLTRNIQSEERGRSTERTFRFAETREHPKQVGGSEGQSLFFSNKVLGLELLFGAQGQTRMCMLDLGDGQFSERCDVDGSFFTSDAIPIILGKA